MPSHGIPSKVLPGIQPFMQTNTPTPCRLCKSPLANDSGITLENLPRGAQLLPTHDELADDHGVSARVRQCVQCGLVQLNGQQVVYREGNTSATCYSPSIVQHRREQAAQFVRQFQLEGRKVLDVGCGDGHFIELLTSAGAVASGIEPSKFATQAGVARGLNITNGYVNRGAPVVGQPFDAFVTIHVLEHVPDLATFLQGIWAALTPNGVGLIEVPCLEQVLERKRIYDFMPDHLSYFSRETLTRACEMNGFDVTEAGRNWHGEHNYVLVRKRPPADLAGMKAHGDDIVANFNAFLGTQGAAGRTVAVWGASHHANVLLGQVNHSGIACVVDSAAYKQGRYMPISHLPIVGPGELAKRAIGTVIILAPRFYEEILHCLTAEQRFAGCVALMNGDRIEVVRE